MKKGSLLKISLVLLCLVQWTAGVFAQPAKHRIIITSPDKNLSVLIDETKDHSIVYSFSANGLQLIEPSLFGVNEPGIIEWQSASVKAVNKSWKPVWGKRMLVPDVYNEGLIDVSLYKIRVRVYNDGFAFRYENANAETERTQFHFSGNYTAWYYNGENANIGPEQLEDAEGIRLPVMTIKADATHYMAVHEAALESGEPLVLSVSKGTKLFTV
ncbi:MAG: glycoside hydrolase family 97 N-terminal domain-containing protein, partial [Niabella sp.]|nr:glycoside hydrolase family 97 N-terminal domain-containing protein [Niabella sp.]